MHGSAMRGMSIGEGHVVQKGVARVIPTRGHAQNVIYFTVQPSILAHSSVLGFDQCDTRIHECETDQAPTVPETRHIRVRKNIEWVQE